MSRATVEISLCGTTGRKNEEAAAAARGGGGDYDGFGIHSISRACHRPVLILRLFFKPLIFWKQNTEGYKDGPRVTLSLYATSLKTGIIIAALKRKRCECVSVSFTNFAKLKYQHNFAMCVYALHWPFLCGPHREVAVPRWPSYLSFCQQEIDRREHEEREDGDVERRASSRVTS